MSAMILPMFLHFRENFVQVDVFYKSLNYEKISAREAFPFLSLLGEVGGFMGLLLGASCLTIIEVLDFVAMLVTKRLRRHKVGTP